MTERPRFQKSKMAALAAKKIRKFSHAIVIVMYKPFIVYLFKGRGAQIFFVLVIKVNVFFQVKVKINFAQKNKRSFIL